MTGDVRLRPRTLLWQFGLVLMAVQAIAAVALGAWAAAAIGEYERDRVTGQMQMLAPLVAARVEPDLRNGDGGGLADLARSLGRSCGARVTVIGPDGRVIADSQEEPADLDNHRFRPEVDSALATGRGTAVRYSGPLGTDLVYVAVAVPPGEPPAAVIRLAMPVSADGAAGRLRGALLAGGLACLGLTLGATWLVSRALSASVMRVARGAAGFAAGDFRHRIARPASRELAAVTDAFNQMAGQIEHSIDQLRAHQHEQQAVLQSMGNGVLALDAEQRVLSVNRAAERMLSLDGQAARGRLLQEVVREPDLHRFVAAVFAGTGKISGELAIRHGTRRTLEALAEPLDDEEGAAAGLVVVLNDVTQLRRLESIRNDFAANVSHELQTPITAIKGYVETLLDCEPPDATEQRRFLEIIARNADRLAAIVEDLLALARLEEPNTARVLERTDTRLAPLLASVAGQFERAASEKAVTLAVDVPDDLRAVINAPLIGQAVGNLVSNAIKFSEPRSAVTLSARLRDGTLDVAVADQGPGIPAHHLPRLFERFYRVDKARSRKFGGTGLGLAIVKHIAMVHGGKATVESDVGRGSVFHILLPAETKPKRSSDRTPTVA